MAVGNGAKTFFWHRRWATNRPLMELAIAEPPLQIQDVTVEEFLDPQVGWLYDKLSNFLPTKALQKIAAYDLIEDDEAIDEIFWNGSLRGFYVGVCYEIGPFDW